MLIDDCLQEHSWTRTYALHDIEVPIVIEEFHVKTEFGSEICSLCFFCCQTFLLVIFLSKSLHYMVT